MDKETFRQEAREKIDFLSKKIDELQKKLDPMTSEAKKEAKIAGEKSLAELKELRVQLQAHLEEFQHAAGDKWKVAVKKFDEVSDEITDIANDKANGIWEKLKRLFE